MAGGRPVNASTASLARDPRATWGHGCRKFTRSLGLCLLICLLTTWTCQTHAQSSNTLATSGRWELRRNHEVVVVSLAGALNTKQKNIINGGFTTVSQLTVRLPPADLDETSIPDENNAASIPPVYQVRCSVKFDAWEETYEVARLNATAHTSIVREFATYASDCLTVSLRMQELANPQLAQRLIRSGGSLLAYLTIKQTSPQEASRIKDWLIQQQSGVIQGLFSHMLGELTLSQTVKVLITIPPKASGDGANRDLRTGPFMTDRTAVQARPSQHQDVRSFPVMSAN